MKSEHVCVLSDADFERAVGVQRDIFDIMVEEVKKNIRNFGRPPKLSRADQLLLTLMYWREYRTEFHIADIPHMTRRFLELSCNHLIFNNFFK